MTYTILIAKDNKEDIEKIKKILQFSQNNYEIISATDGKSACDLALTKNPHLILLNPTLPKMSGIEVLKFLKTYRKTKDIPIIMINPPNLQETIPTSIMTGAIDYIRMPIDSDELKIRVNSFLLFHNTLRKIKEQNIKIKKQAKKLKLLNENLQKFFSAFQKVENAIVILSPSGYMEWANDGFYKLYGSTLTEFRKKFGDTIYESSKNPNIDETFRQLLKTKSTITYLARWETKSRPLMWIHTTLSPIINQKGEIEKVVAIENDITEMKVIADEMGEYKEDMTTLTEHLVNATQQLELQKREIERQKELSDNLLVNILPYQTAEELKVKGYASPRYYPKVTVMFADFKEFTRSCEGLSPTEIVNELDTYFAEFDEIIERNYIEKIKTIGDAYMCAGGVPIRNNSNPIDVVLAGLEMQKFMSELNRFKRAAKLPCWYIRLGIHTGEVIAGVVGKRKFAYDIWGETVNIASRIEITGETGKVNISAETYKYIKDFFDCSYRGKIELKYLGVMDIYLVARIKPMYSLDKEGTIPNEEFQRILSVM